MKNQPTVGVFPTHRGKGEGDVDVLAFAKKDFRVWEDYRLFFRNSFLTVDRRFPLADLSQQGRGTSTRRRSKSEPPIPVSLRFSESGALVPRCGITEGDGDEEQTFVESLENVGSLMHRPGGNCRGRACFFAHGKKGCSRGWLCVACHYCPPLPAAPSEKAVYEHVTGSVNFLRNRKNKTIKSSLQQHQQRKTSSPGSSSRGGGIRGAKAVSRASSFLSYPHRQAGERGGFQPHQQQTQQRWTEPAKLNHVFSPRGPRGHHGEGEGEGYLQEDQQNVTSAAAFVLSEPEERQSRGVTPYGNIRGRGAASGWYTDTRRVGRGGFRGTPRPHPTRGAYPFPPSDPPPAVPLMPLPLSAAAAAATAGGQGQAQVGLWGRSGPASASASPLPPPTQNPQSQSTHLLGPCEVRPRSLADLRQGQTEGRLLSGRGGVLGGVHIQRAGHEGREGMMDSRRGPPSPPHSDSQGSSGAEGSRSSFSISVSLKSLSGRSSHKSKLLGTRGKGSRGGAKTAGEGSFRG
uniref:Uncharacterized protein n=1 Tax=Chromera velia CCMP2878 TaxID=1169474 RepID=A0A0G4HBP9_9ALVE|eukprot:Cvel_25908.t1-p1 / transcript=Cvel_25908.t1 / gene=Cvel_25908 / organism=Chromera_velia_CCMP2878 / gene_product=hypothetical protein / transcript_product=hypothetical protein / location=Cvel_scaffold2994:509-2362(+) / protein_length=516 / sequence_SO=supercontig / SO=protein_coding / is_pseudo=false